MGQDWGRAGSSTWLQRRNDDAVKQFAEPSVGINMQAVT